MKTCRVRLFVTVSVCLSCVRACTFRQATGRVCEYCLNFEYMCPFTTSSV